MAQIADALKFSGVWLLNASYQWGCTSLAREQDGVPWLLRTLDWPFRGLGHHVEVARMGGDGGEFFSVTWPGYVGVLTAMAPGRLRRRSIRRRCRGAPRTVGCGRTIRRQRGRDLDSADRMPAEQLLRQAFETCADYATARRMLETAAVARPAIYTLVGCAAGERCVIERTEKAFVTREDDTCAANDWVPPSGLGRPHRHAALSHQFIRGGDREEYGAPRCAGLLGGGVADEDRFGWVREPVLNPYTRLAVACVRRPRSYGRSATTQAAGRWRSR